MITGFLLSEGLHQTLGLRGGTGICYRNVIFKDINSRQNLGPTDEFNPKRNQDILQNVTEE